MAENTEVFGWDDSVQDIDEGFVVFEPGDYKFEVTQLEKGYFNGSEKMPACPMATVKLAVINDEGQKCFVDNRLFLSKSHLYRLKKFFVAIGLAKEGNSGGTINFDWNKVVGSTGWLRLGKREYDGNTYANVKGFYSPAEVAKKGLAAPATPQAGVF